MTTDYRHSNTFASLKGVRETLNGNHSTVQYMRILDAYLTAAIEPLLLRTNYADNKLCELLAWSTHNSRRKITMDKSIDHPGIIYDIVSRPVDDTRRLLLWKSLKVDRGVAFYILDSFLHDVGEKYESVSNCDVSKPAGTIGSTLSFNGYAAQKLEAEYECVAPLIGTHKQVAFWEPKARAFKRVIIEKYVRFCLMTAQRDYTGFFAHEVELDDIIQAYLFMASRAIDRCDADQGALTSHITNWFLTARNKLNIERQNRHKEDQFGDLSLNSSDTETSVWGVPSLSVDDVASASEETQHLYTIAKQADQEGLGRYLAGFEESLSPSEVNLLKSLAV